jgi:hypothetical protein
MALKDFDFKGFLLARGERVGLYTAGGIGLLIVLLSLFWPGKGLFSASPKGTADKIQEGAKTGMTRLATAAPSESEIKELVTVPDELKKQSSLVPLDPDEYRLSGEIFAARDVKSNKRRNPSVLVPDEFLAQVVPAQISSFMTNVEGDTVRYGILTGKGGKPGGPGGFDPFKIADNMYGPGRGSGGPGGPGGPGGRGMGPGGYGMGAPPGYQRGTGNMFGSGGEKPGTGPFGSGGDEKREIKYETKENLASVPKENYARDLTPRQIAIVAGSFPYRAQVEEFKKALRLADAAAVLNEVVAEKDADGNPQQKQAFRFMGFDVQRKAYGRDGKPIGDWADLDLGPKSDYAGLVLAVLKEFAPEDQRIRALLVRNLYLPKPVQVPDKEHPATSGGKPYPNVAGQLPKIQATLKELEEKAATAVAQQTPAKADEGFNPFGDENPTAGAGTGYQMAPQFDPRKVKEGTKAQEAWKPPEYSVFRFLDVTVQPGQTYEYRVRLRMANPNYDKPENVADVNLTKEKELTSVWQDVKGPDGHMLRVTVPSDLLFYAVDEKLEHGKDYKGLNPDARPGADQAVVQAHRWVDNYYLGAGRGKAHFPVGDWVIGERLFAYRGEYAGQDASAHLPIWEATQSKFVLAGRPPARGKDQRPTVPVSFGAHADGNKPERSPLLVDFEGGRLVTYHRPGSTAPKKEETTPPDGAAPPDEPPPDDPDKPAKSGGKAVAGADIKEVARAELLFLTRDGKLLAHDSATDAVDEERVAREEDYTKRVEEASGETRPDAGGKPGGPGKPGGKP